MSICSTGPYGSSRQTQACHQAGDWSSPDRGDSAERCNAGREGRAPLTARTVAWYREGRCSSTPAVAARGDASKATAGKTVTAMTLLRARLGLGPTAGCTSTPVRYTQPAVGFAG